MKKSENEELMETISKARSSLEHIFPIEVPFDSTGGKPGLQPLRARPLLKWLVVCASYFLAGLIVLVLHFNIGFMVSIPLAIAMLWMFAMHRDLPPAPLQVDIKFWSDGSLCIGSDRASVYLNDVGPVWIQEGLVFALAHDFEKVLANGSKSSAAILPALRGRAAKLGTDSWDLSDIDDSRKHLFPGTWSEGARLDEVIRRGYTLALERSPETATPVPILLGKFLEDGDAEYRDQALNSIAAFNIAGLVGLSGKWARPEDGETKSHES